MPIMGKSTTKVGVTGKGLNKGKYKTRLKCKGLSARSHKAYSFEDF